MNNGRMSQHIHSTCSSSRVSMCRYAGRALVFSITSLVLPPFKIVDNAQSLNNPFRLSTYLASPSILLVEHRSVCTLSESALV